MGSGFRWNSPARPVPAPPVPDGGTWKPRKTRATPKHDLEVRATRPGELPCSYRAPGRSPARIGQDD